MLLRALRAWLHRPVTATTASSLVVKLMLFATYALALTAAVAVVLEIVLLWSVDDHGMIVGVAEREHRGEEPPLEPEMLDQSMPQLELNASESALSQQEAENIFLELVPPPGFTQCDLRATRVKLARSGGSGWLVTAPKGPARRRTASIAHTCDRSPPMCAYYR